MPRLDPASSKLAGTRRLQLMPELDAVADGVLGLGAENIDPSGWAQSAIESTQDIAGTMFADVVSIGRGVPYAGGQFAAGVDIIGKRPSFQAIRALVADGPADAGLDSLTKWSLGPLRQGLEGMVGPQLHAMAGQLASVAGAAVPIVGTIAVGWAKMFADARSWRRPNEDPSNAYPSMTAATDRAQAEAVLRAVYDGEMTRLFRPPGHPFATDAWPAWSHGYGDLDFATGGRLMGAGSIAWSGYGVGSFGRDVANGVAFGGHPHRLKDGTWNVTLHRGVICGTDVGADVFDAGALLPQTTAALAQAWAMASNPAGTLLWTLDAEQLHNTWVEYLAGLRRMFHLVTVGNGGTLVQDHPAGHVLSTLKPDTTSSASGRPGIKSRLELVRRFAVDAMAETLGWPKWGPLDDADLAGNGARDVREYVARYNLRGCHAPRAMRWLYGRQVAATKTASVAYCNASNNYRDAAIANNAKLRAMVKEGQQQLRSARAVRYVDLELVPDTGYRQSITGRTRPAGEQEEARASDLVIGGGGVGGGMTGLSSGGGSISSTPIVPAIQAKIGPVSVSPATSPVRARLTGALAGDDGLGATAGDTVEDDGASGAVAAAGGLGLVLLLLALL